MTKIAKEILEQKAEEEQVRLLNEAIKEACLKDKSHTELLGN